MTLEELAARVLRCEQALGLAQVVSDPVIGVRPTAPSPTPASPPVAPSTGGREGAVAPTTSIGRPGAAAAGPAVDHAFTWGMVGEVPRVTFTPDRPYSFSTTPPPGYAGWLAFVLVQQVGVAFVPVPVTFWISTSPNGPVIPGTFYSGAYNAQTLGGEEFKCLPEGGVPYYFNIRVGAVATFGVEQDHQ